MQHNMSTKRKCQSNYHHLSFSQKNVELTEKNDFGKVAIH